MAFGVCNEATLLFREFLLDIHSIGKRYPHSKSNKINAFPLVLKHESDLPEKHTFTA